MCEKAVNTRTYSEPWENGCSRGACVTQLQLTRNPVAEITTFHHPFLEQRSEWLGPKSWDQLRRKTRKTRVPTCRRTETS